MGSAETQGRLWGNATRQWVELQAPMFTPLWEGMLNATIVGQGTRFLDVGCGGGGASILAAERGALVSGLDAADALIRIARERMPDGSFHVGDMEALPFPSGSFDAVIAANSLQYADDRIAALRELRRVSVSQGLIAVGLWSTPVKVDNSVIISAVRDALPEPPEGEGPFELSYPGILEDLIEQAGLHVVEYAEVECPFHYPDFESFWQSRVGAGPTQRAMQAIGEPRLDAVLREAVKPFLADDGSIRLENRCLYVTATP